LIYFLTETLKNTQKTRTILIPHCDETICYLDGNFREYLLGTQQKRSTNSNMFFSTRYEHWSRLYHITMLFLRGRCRRNKLKKNRKKTEK